MLKKDAINYFGSITNLAASLKISTQAISQWGKYIPPLRAFQLEYLTQGKLKARKIPNRNTTASVESTT